jgi:hypothetical protein
VGRVVGLGEKGQTHYRQILGQTYLRSHHSRGARGASLPLETLRKENSREQSGQVQTIEQIPGSGRKGGVPLSPGLGLSGIRAQLLSQKNHL